MSREKINWKVEEKDVLEFTAPINIEIPIDKGQYGYIFKGTSINNLSPKDYLKKLELEIIDKLFTRDEHSLYKRMLNSKISLSYIPDFKNNKWYIGYSPIYIINNIFDILDIDEQIDYIDYCDKTKIKKAIRNIKLTLFNAKLDILRDKYKENKAKFIDDVIDGVDKIFLLTDYDIQKKLEGKIRYKNLLHYLSVKSLDLLDSTNDIRYSVIPKEYYDEVSSIKKAEYPNQLYMEDRVYSYNYDTFNKRFKTLFTRYPIIFEQEIGISKINIIDKFDIIKKDRFTDEISSVYVKYKIKKNRKGKQAKNKKELDDMLENKMLFYRELIKMKDENNENIVISPIKGKNDLFGYYGFVLKNNYIVFDKFYTISETDNTIKPVSNEAIYILPIDLFMKLEGSKQKMMKYIRHNKNGYIKRIYHNNKYSYREKVMDFISKEDVSYLKHDSFLNIYSKNEVDINKVLTKKNN